MAGTMNGEAPPAGGMVSPDYSTTTGTSTGGMTPDLPDGPPLDAAVSVTPIWATGDGQGWQPRASAGLAVSYSASERAVVVFGGNCPGLGRSDELACGFVQRQAKPPIGMPAPKHPKPPSLRWERVAPSMVIPRRCFGGATILSGAAGGDRLLLIGGEGEPQVSKTPQKRESSEPPPTAMMLNDTWTIELRSAKAMNLIPSIGAPPTPRTRHTIAALADPQPTGGRLGLGGGKLRSKGLGMMMVSEETHTALEPPGPISHAPCLLIRARTSLSRRRIAPPWAQPLPNPSKSLAAAA